MSNSRPSPHDNFSHLLQELRANVNTEGVGFTLLLLGGFFLVTLFASGVPWLIRMTGWTAPLVALSLLIAGLLLILHARGQNRYTGYWSVEALLGTELFLLFLQASTFTLNNPTVDWTPTFDGSNGGLVGWSIGSILVAALGQWPAFALLLLMGGAGLYLLYRSTPLIYIGAYLAPYRALIPLLWAALTNRPASASSQSPSQSAPPDAERAIAPAAAHNFVAPQSGSQSGPHRQPRRRRSAGTEQYPVVVEVSPHAASSEQIPLASLQPSPKQSAQATASRTPATKLLRKADELPPLDLLDDDAGIYGGADTREMQQRIVQTLEDFDVPVRVVHVESGPTVTQFGVEPLYLERAGQRRKVRVSRIVNLADDLALALEAQSVRIEAPVPGRPYVGIEVPNYEKKMVGLRGILASPLMRREGGQLGLGLGRNTAGEPVVIDLVKAPHILVAGATGAGKSVCINTIITSLLMQHGPESLQFVMVDPKMVELPNYNGIPHLIGKVITEMDQVMGMLTWLLLQMDDRYRAFKEAGARNIEVYNSKVRRLRGNDAPQPLPYIVLVVDELADLMMTAADDVERQICRLAQMARATGIHLILATQRPSVDVVTGLIKANFPTRIAFAVTSQIDSRVIMDTPGAERLLGRGDMLLMRSDSSKLQRVQGCFVSDEEINRVTEYWRTQVADAERAHPLPWAGLLDRLDDQDELVQEAIDVLYDLLDSGETICSTSLLQRRLRIGYPKAAQLVEKLADQSIVGPDLGRGQGRAILLNTENEEENEEDE